MPQQHYRVATYSARRSIGFLLKRAHALIAERIEPQLAQAGLTFTQYVVMVHLRDRPAVSATVLCDQLCHDSGALTRVLDQLEARDFIQRERSREDRRSVLLQLTEHGRQALEVLLPRVIDRLNETLSDFSRSDLTELTRLLAKLIGQLESSAAAPLLPVPGELA
jgi:DNA-binding MarR family transcriptional regulator